MKEKIKSWTRPTGKWSDMLLIAAFLSVVLMYAGDFLAYFIYYSVPIEEVFALITDSENVIYFMCEYFLFFGNWIVFILVFWVFKNNRPMLKQLAPNKDGNNLKGALIGLLLGSGSNGLCILISAITGDIKLYYNEFNPAIFFTFVFVVLVQSGAEEITDRIYLYQKLRRRYKNPIVAIVGNAAVFAALHLFNPGITAISVLDIVASGVLFTLFVYYYDSVWAAIMYHAAWNFTQNIAFGLPNSGLVSEYSLFKLEAASATNGLFYNVDFGVEGSVGAVLVECSLLIVIIVLNRGKSEKNDIWAESEKPDSQITTFNGETIC